MEAKELRIGNYVYPFDDVCLVNNKTIFRDFIKVVYRDFENTLHLHPIPLTEEWLVEFEFEKALNGWWSDNEIWSYNDGKFYLGANTYLSNVKYVHQLQNLYFALTNEELTINQ